MSTKGGLSRVFTDVLIGKTYRKEYIRGIEKEIQSLRQYNEYIYRLNSIHKKKVDEINWEEIKATKPPTKLIKSNKYQELAKNNLDRYKPSFFDKRLGLEKFKKKRLMKKLETAKQADEREYLEIVKTYEQEYKKWKENYDMACRVLGGVPKSYIELVTQLEERLKDLIWAKMSFFVKDRYTAEVILEMDRNKVIPKFEIAWTKSGGVKIKEMPKSRFNELYQFYVCSSVLRVAKELFGNLPLKLILIHCTEKCLNTITGHMEVITLLSVGISRKILSSLNFEMLHPPDSINNFVNNMKFKKLKGFSPVEKIRISDFNSEK